MNAGYSATPLTKKLEKQLKDLRKRLEQNGFVWVSWPKKASKVETDITEDTIRALALPLGFVDVKVCAVSDVWSGLKLVIGKADSGLAAVCRVASRPPPSNVANQGQIVRGRP